MNWKIGEQSPKMKHKDTKEWVVQRRKIHRIHNQKVNHTSSKSHNKREEKWKTEAICRDRISNFKN